MDKIQLLAKMPELFREAYDKVKPVKEFVDKNCGMEETEFWKEFSMFLIRENINLGVTCFNLQIDKQFSKSKSASS